MLRDTGSIFQMRLNPSRFILISSTAPIMDWPIENSSQSTLRIPIYYNGRPGKCSSARNAFQTQYGLSWFTRTTPHFAFYAVFSPPVADVSTVQKGNHKVYPHGYPDWAASLFSIGLHWKTLLQNNNFLSSVYCSVQRFELIRRFRHFPFPIRKRLRHRNYSF